MMSKRNVVKAVANYAVYSLACDTIEKTVEENTDFVPEENLPVRLACYTAALYFTSFTKPLVNKAVDTVADKYVERKATRAAAKQVVETAA
jgi:hypothetical protein